MTAAVLDIHVGELRASARVIDQAMCLTLLGTAEAASEPALNDLLGRLHNESQRAAAREVVVDFHGLEFMNSSCFKSFITWIVAVRRLPKEQHYRICFRANPKFRWQARSLHAIRSFGGELVSVING